MTDAQARKDDLIRRVTGGHSVPPPASDVTPEPVSVAPIREQQETPTPSSIDLDRLPTLKVGGQTLTLPPGVLPEVDSEAFMEPLIEPQNASESPTIPESEKPKETEPDKLLTPHGLERCPRCKWDLHIPDTVVATENDISAYTAFMLTGQLFTKSYQLFKGQMTVVFRELTSAELDACWSELALAVKENKVNPGAEFDYFVRLRFALQLVSLSSTLPGGLRHEMPAGLDPTTAPGASSYWYPEVRLGTLPAVQDYAKGNRGIMQIFTGLQKEVMKTESLLRICLNQLIEFNRLVNKLEDAAKDPNFSDAVS